jgi:hypothetical protein
MLIEDQQVIYSNVPFNPNRWKAPEYSRRSKTKLTNRIDVFGFGIILYEVFMKSFPWCHLMEKDVWDKFREGSVPKFPPDIPAFWQGITSLCITYLQ